MFRMQRYMCSRFFIDYKTEPEQRHVINQYVTTHFIPSSIPNTEQSIQRRQQHSSNSKSLSSSPDHNHLHNARLCLLFFDHLFNVIQHSTVCLTHHDKQITLMMINQLRDFYHFNYKNLFPEENYYHQHHQQQQRYPAYPYQHYYHHHHHHRHHNHCSSSSSNSSRSVRKML